MYLIHTLYGFVVFHMHEDSDIGPVCLPQQVAILTHRGRRHANADQCIIIPSSLKQRLSYKFKHIVKAGYKRKLKVARN